jgi:hypothetical protein
MKEPDPVSASIQSAQGETGDRNVACGHDSFQVTGDGHRGRPFGSQPFSLQPPEPRCQTHPALVPSGPRVLELCPQPIIRLPYAAPFEFRLFWSTEPPCLRASSSFFRPTGQLITRSTIGASRVCPLSPCPLAHVSPLARYFAGEGKIPPLAIVTILKSPPEAETQRR